MRVYPGLMFTAVGFLFLAALLGVHGKWAAVCALVSLAVGGLCALFDFTLEVTRVPRPGGE